ncbi:MAG TPA: NAD(P)/FAD-dependent oxidoreductase [Streptosporangiaceae bacterium]|nr:NAD(P)/FAD-dependent oxidoreductase [Streptosporangiaceae bacterium]
MEFDVIVVGAGLSGGLPAAAYLQKAGLQVLVVEANAEAGTFCCTHETWPQTLDSPHVGVSFAGNSPVIADLDLESFGFRFAASPVILATTYADGTNCLICQEPARTAENFARHSARDGQRMLEIQSRVDETMVEFNELSSFSPHPDPGKLRRIFDLCAYAMDYPVEQMMEMTGPELCERTFETDACRQILMTPVAFWEHGAPFARGQGAFGTTFALYYTTGVGIGGNEVLVDALTRCFLAHGGELWTSAQATEVLVSGGRAVGVRLSGRSVRPEAEVTARIAVISNAGVHETLQLVGEDAIRQADPLLAAKMRYWKMGLRGSHVTSWLLDRRISWKSAAFDPLIDEAILVYRAFDSWAGTKQYLVDMLGNDTWRASGQLMEFTYPAAADPSSVSPDGHTILRAEECFPYALHGLGGPAAWDGPLRGELVAARSAVLAGLAGDWDEAVLDCYDWTPLDNWRLNRSARFGQVVGGDFTEDQWILGRMPYRMPLPGLYMSNGVWPVGLSWMAAGYNAAQVVAADAGVRQRDWWRSRPCEWYYRNLPRLLPAGAGRDAVKEGERAAQP